MKYVAIPNSTLHVSQICLGTGEIGARLAVPAAMALMDEFVALGGTFIDTAHVYSDWIPGTKSTSEKTIGQWMKANGLRDRIIIGTKGAHPLLSSMNISRLSRADIEQDVSESLDYLQTDLIDLYWLHRDDPAIPVSEIIDVLNERVTAGNIRYLGASNWSAARIEAANAYAHSKGIQGFVANQPLWSLAAPTLDAIPDKTIVAMDAAALDYHRRSGLAAIPFSSQAHGFFGKMHAANPADIAPNDLRVYDNPINRARLTRVEMLAKKYDVPINDIVLAYLLSQSFVTIPIVGCKTSDQLRASVRASEVRLTPDEVATLEQEVEAQ